VKRGTIKEKIAFGIISLISALSLWFTTFIGAQKVYPLNDEECMRILFLGDSNYAYEYDGYTIPQRIGEALNAEIYNCAVGGTTAAKLPTADYIDTKMDMFCLHNMVRLMETSDLQSVRDFHGIFNDYEYHGLIKATILTDIDLKQMDYIVISYGVNDYTSGLPLYGESNYDEKTYTGALRKAIERIQNLCPDAKIILSSITYCALINEKDYQDGYEVSWGGGTIDEYRDAMQLVATEYKNVYFIDNLNELPIAYENFEQYLSDGLHLNATGQQVYAEHFVSLIKEIESDVNEK